MSKPEQFAVTYWLLPAAPARDFFCETIHGLAEKYGAPTFDPHLTLAVQPDSADEAERRLARLPDGLIELRLIEVAWASAFTRTLFLCFASTSRLLQLRSSLGEDEDRDFDPHLSLLYQKMPTMEQARLAAEMELPFSSVIFDTVVAMRCRLPVETAADVAVWKCVATRSLVSEEAG